MRNEDIPVIRRIPTSRKTFLLLQLKDISTMRHWRTSTGFSTQLTKRMKKLTS